MVFPAPLEPTIATTGAGRNPQVNILQYRAAPSSYEKLASSNSIDCENRGSTFAPGASIDFFGQIEKREDLRGNADRLQEQLINVAEPLDRLVGLEQREDERAEQRRWSSGRP